MRNSDFRTEVSIKSPDLQIGLKDKVLTIGSCFSDVIGSYLSHFKFDVLANPFGTVYNPTSIFKLLLNKPVNTELFVKREGLYLHHDYHSNLIADSKSELSDTIHNKHIEVDQYLSSCTVLIITLGTSVVYEHLAQEQIVANCHKVPQIEFSKRLLTIEEIKRSFDELYQKLREVNKNSQIILTVSPVRHIKDGIELNTVSKSLLKVATHELVNEYSGVSYFPSYEIMMDDLRDYRFYREDLIHPTKMAEEYIWNKFKDSYFNASTNDFIKDWGKILTALNHKPFNPNSQKHQKFVKNTLQKLRSFTNIIDIKKEEEILTSQLL